MERPQSLFPHWMRGFLLAAAGYNVLWGVLIGWFPETFYQWVTESEMAVPDIISWQGKGVLVMAIVYFLCAIHPGKFWFLIVLGAMTKLFGGIWFYFSILDQEVGKKATFHLLMNDFIWIPLLLWIGYRALQYKKLKA